jgi:glycosyltransferase involved in cell wall biosynthesis
MRVLIHGLAMHKRGGGSRHLEGLVEALDRLGGQDEYVLLLDRRFEFDGSSPNVKVHRVEIKSVLHRVWLDQVVVPRLARARGIDVVVALFVFGSLRLDMPQVVLQRNSQFYCDAYLHQVRGRSRAELLLRRKMAYLTMRASRAIVTPSAAMRDMILRYHPDLSRDRFRVLPHGFERKQLDRRPVSDSLNEKLASIQDRPMILYVSHLEPHKAHDVAVRAMRELRKLREDVCLLLTMARQDWTEGYDRLMRYIHKWELEDTVINLGRVPEGTLDAFYRRADIFFFPSLCESFGFPMVEALGYGLPVVAADTSINREICGSAARYYDPSNSKAAAGELATLIGSANRRRKAGGRSEAQFPKSHLSWSEYATRFVGLLREVIV